MDDPSPRALRGSTTVTDLYRTEGAIGTCVGFVAPLPPEHHAAPMGADSALPQSIRAETPLSTLAKVPG